MKSIKTENLILSKLNKVISEFKNDIDKHNWKQTEFYQNYLAQTYYYVSHSTRLLALSSGLSGFDKNGVLYHTRSTTHISEEFNHHYMALSDLKKLGGNISEIPEFFSTKNLYQSQYYLIMNKSPYALLGYILFLEAASTQITELVGMLTEHYGKQCCVFLREHLELDSGDDGHLDKALQLVNKLSEEEQNIIIENIELSYFNFQSLLNECEHNVLSMNESKAG